MTNEQITAALDTLFRQIDGVQRKRQLVFWYDPKEEFREVLDTVPLTTGVKKIILQDNPFSVKYQVLVQEPETSFLLYAPIERPDIRDNWLLDLELQGEAFSADRAQVLWREFGFHDRNLMNYIREHLSYFNSKKRTEAFELLDTSPDASEMDLRLAMMCALLGLKVADARALIRTVLMQGLTPSDNKAFQEITKFFEGAEFWQIVETTLQFKAEQPSLRELFIRLAITHMAHDLRGNLNEALTAKRIRPSNSVCAFVDDWLRSTDAAVWREYSQRLEADLGLHEFVGQLEPGEYQEVQTFRIFDEVLIQDIATRLTEGRLEGVAEWISNRKPRFWYSAFEHAYGAVEHAHAFLTLLSSFESKLGGGLETLFKTYAHELSKLDFHYRKFALHYGKLEQKGLKALDEHIEAAYSNTYLPKLSEAWTLQLKEKSSWNFMGMEKQWHFFEHHVRPILRANDREKVYVIISDALRYEVATELRLSLQKDLRGEPELKPLLSVLPSITKLGKAALLPGEQLAMSDKGKISLDGQATDAGNRETLLRRSGLAAQTIKANELLNWSQKEGRDAMADHRLFYIYHDTIDAIGDKAASESRVFEACETAVDEINKMVRRLVHSFNATHVLITSDHGFLYQRQSLESHEKLPQPKGQIFDSGRRHVSGLDLAKQEGVLSFTTPYLEPEGLITQVPNGTLRYALQGSGVQYVHGGASLQEVCVPFIEYHHVRASSPDDKASDKVGVRLNATARKITNNHFTLRLVQTEPIGERFRPRQVRVFFVDEQGKAITNEFPIYLDSSAQQASDREFIARLSIGITNPDRNKPYTLKVVDVEDDFPLITESWQINLAFTDDFGDF